MNGTWHAFETGAQRLDVEVVADYTHARNIDTGQPIPRIAPLRTTLALDYAYGPYGARGEMVHAWGQDSIACRKTICRRRATRRSASS